MPNTQERTYKFTIQKDANSKPRIQEVKESKLKDKHIHLLLGDLIQKFNYMPEQVKLLFIEKIAAEAKSKTRIIKP